MADLTKKSNAWLARRYNAIIRKWYKSGGTEYGVDWPTARILWPDDYAEIQELKAEAKRRQGVAI